MNINDKKLIKEDDAVLLIGTFGSAAIRNEIYMAHHDVEARQLTSSPKNWESIIEEIDLASQECRPVFINLTESVMIIASNSQYRNIFQKLLMALNKTKHIVFIYNDSFCGKYNIFSKSYYRKYVYYEDQFLFGQEVYKHNIDAHIESIRERYISYVNDYCDEFLSPLNTAMPKNEQLDVINSIKDCLLSNVNLRDHFDKEHLMISTNYIVANNLCNSLYELSLAKEKQDIERLISSIRTIRGEHPQIVDDIVLREIDTEGVPSLDRIDDYDIETDSYKEYTKEYIATSSKRIKFHYPLDASKSFEYRLSSVVNQHPDVKKAISGMNSIIETITAINLNIAPFTHSVDIVSAIREFFLEEENHTVYMRYVYKDQAYAFELERFLALFQDYISKVKHGSIVFEEKKTEIGIVYVIRSSDEDTTKETISLCVQEFADFLDHCDYDTEYARSILANHQLTSAQCNALLFRFQKEAKRLKLDIKHETEMKMLQLRQKYENIASEIDIENLPIPMLQGMQLSSSDTAITNLMKIDNSGVINIQNIYGNATFNDNDKQLFDLIEKYAENNQELIDAVKILKDGATPNELKNDSSVKLKRFLATTASKIGDVGFTLLTKYLENQLLG